ncbi:glycosyltransferase [Croceicoccus mobilis]|uniref:Glycosyl transferase family 1 domain-containing protein n=1 Tax=Croceicoccus mobilis TaxID=1703339 RepID=A0A917DUD4_9SPHN|nr:glycosyltransferase [Croceicoccus mobilis]GGD67655.1 hypothetical protein GCM10010990_16430 [Croceicoccus mobilis]
MQRNFLIAETWKKALKTQPLIAPWARAGLETSRSIRSLAKLYASGTQFDRRITGANLVSVCHPNWQGVRSASEGQGGDMLYLPDMTARGVAKAADLILEAGYTHVAFNGFWIGYDWLARRLKSQRPSIRLFGIWHGSFAQVTETFEGADDLKRVTDLAREGVLDRIGFVKNGMEKVFRYFGTPADLVLNRVPLQEHAVKEWDENAIALIPSGPNIRKNCHTQIIAALMSECFAEIHVIEDELEYLYLDERQRQRLHYCKGLSRAEIFELMARSTLAFNVTLSECAPMVVLEGIAFGTPCLSGNNHGIYDSNETLRSMLLVNREDDVCAIVDGILAIRENYPELLAQLHRFAIEYDRMASDGFEEFLNT